MNYQAINKTIHPGEEPFKFIYLSLRNQSPGEGKIYLHLYAALILSQLFYTPCILKKTKTIKLTSSMRKLTFT